MTEHYHDPRDRSYMKYLRKNSPTAFQDMASLTEHAVNGEDSSIPPRYAELIALGVALTTQCSYCIEAHVTAAHAAGASEKNVSDSVMIAAALRAGGAFAHGMMAMKFYRTASASDPEESV